MAFLSGILKHKRETGATYIQLWDAQQMNTLLKKLGVSSSELNDAILETGSLDLNYIKAYLKRKKEQVIFVKRVSTFMHY